QRHGDKGLHQCEAFRVQGLFAVAAHYSFGLRCILTVSTSAIAPVGDWTRILTVRGIHCESWTGVIAAANGNTSTRQRWPSASPVSSVRVSSVPSGIPAKTLRIVSISATFCSSDRVPRVVTPITDPIAVNDTAISASAISTSMIVKPASDLARLGGDTWNNF